MQKIPFIFHLSVQYLVHLYQYFNEWRKNPHWSFSCCLALLLPLNDLQGEIRGMVGKNVLKTQLQTGTVDKPSIASSAKDSGAMSITLMPGDGKRSDENTMELHERNWKVDKTVKIKSHQGTQTETIARPVAAFMTRELVEGSDHNKRCVLKNTEKNQHYT